ncbi:hypothetical protein ACVWY0_003174 [Arthrobacter sp. UYNi723]
MTQESTESLQAQIKVLEDRVKVLEEAVKPANLLAAIQKRQQSLAV